MNLGAKGPQKSMQIELPLGRRGETARAERSGEAAPATNDSEGSGTSSLMERALERSNMLAALKRVRRNKGSAGVDRMTVDELPDYLRQHWPRIRQQLLDGSYEPKAVRRCEIPKPGGGTRTLGIPAVIDRLIQQAMLQAVQPEIDKTFSERSYGFRPGRSAHDAIKQARNYVARGMTTVVDIDLEKFFDNVDHDILMGKLAKRIADKRVLRLIRRYLEAGALSDGMLVERLQGTPQGGPLSPLLANVMLDEVDKFLEARGRAFVRYADDCNVYVRNERVGQRVLLQLRRLFTRLKLRINEAKTAVADSSTRKLLGYTVHKCGGGAGLRVSTQAMKKFKAEVRARTKRSHSKSIQQFVDHLAPLLRGWGNYFSLTPKAPRQNLDSWIRRRLRMIQMRQCGGGTKARAMLRKLGAPSRKVHFEFGKQWDRFWHVSGLQVVQIALPNRYFAKLGLPSLAP